MSLDDFYPNITLDAFCAMIESNCTIEAKVTVGATVAYVLEGTKSVTERTIYVRSTRDRSVDYYFATAYAKRYRFLDALIQWYDENKDWKSGAYVERPEKVASEPAPGANN